MKNGGATVGGVLLGLFILALIIFMPFLVIWALNTLFGLTIGYTLKTWFATFVLCMVVNSKSHTSK